MERVERFVEGLSIAELEEFTQHLQQGSMLHTKVKDIVTQRESLPCKSCAHCGTQITDPLHHTFTLVFGPQDFRKKATLCGIDCLQTFTQRLQVLQQKYVSE